MTMTATRTPARALGPSAGPTGDRKPDRRTALADLADELHALRSERDAIRAELVTLRNMITYAFGQDAWHVALNVRDRLAWLAIRLERRGTA